MCPSLKTVGCKLRKTFAAISSEEANYVEVVPHSLLTPIMNVCAVDSYYRY